MGVLVLEGADATNGRLLGQRESVLQHVVEFDTGTTNGRRAHFLFDHHFFLMNCSIPLNLAHVSLVGQFPHTHSVVGKSSAMLGFILNEFKGDDPIIELFVFPELLALVTATGKD